MLRLIFVRHGEIQGAEKGTYYGFLDLQLSENGKLQAKNAASLIKKYAIDGVFCSPLSRAKNSMEIICNQLAINPLIAKADNRLTEMNFGDAEGKTYAQIQREFPDYANKMHSDWQNAQAPNGESPTQFFSRVQEFLYDIINQDNQTLLIVTHAGCIRALLAKLLNINDAFWRIKIDYGSVVIVEITDGYAVLSL